MVIRVANGGIIKGTGGGILRGRAVSAALHSFDLTNTEGATTSTGFGRVGLAFEKGDVPSGNILRAEIGGVEIRSAMLNINTWSDGSLRSCALAYDASTFTAAQTKTIDVRAVTGTQGTSGLNPVTYLSGEDDLNVQVTNHSGHSTGALSDRAYSLNAALAVGTRHEITDDTPLCVRLLAWQLPSGEVHLKCYHHVDLWLDDQGIVEAVEWTPVMAQDWIVDDPLGTGSVQKELRTYDAAIREATTNLESHTGLQHGYHCWWAGLRTADDDQHGRRLWIDKGTAMPTLNLAYSDASKIKMAKAGYFPPLAQGITYAAGSFADTIVPLGELGTAGNVHNHRRAINGTGAYNGRGLLSDMDSRALVEQTAARWRVARVSAQAGLSMFTHYRDHRVVDTVDYPGLVPGTIAQLGAQSYTDLGDEDTVLTTAGNFSDGQNFDTVSGPTISATTPGSVGTFTNWDSSHHHSYAYMMAFVEGEAYLADAVLSQFNMTHIRSNLASTNENRLAFQGAGTRATAFSIPSTNYGNSHIVDDQERAIAWSMLSQLRAHQLLPDGDKHIDYIDNQWENFDEWVTDSLSFFPAAETTRGGWEPRFSTGAPIGSQFMNSFGVMCAWTAVPLVDDLGYSGARDYAEQVTKLLGMHWDVAPYMAMSDRDLRFLDGTDRQVAPPDNEGFLLRGGSVTSDVFSYTDILGALKIRNDDIVYMSEHNSQGTGVAIPTGLSRNTRYFVVNANTGASTFQLSLTQGGAAVTGITDAGDVQFGVFAADFALTPLGTNSADIPTDDSSGQIAYCALQVAYGYGSVNVSASLISDAETFYAPKETNWGGSAYAAWNMDGDLIR